MIEERTEYKIVGGDRASYTRHNLGRAITRAALDGWKPAFNMIDRRHHTGYEILLTRTVKVTDDNIAEFIEQDYRDTYTTDNDGNLEDPDELIKTFARRYGVDQTFVAEIVVKVRNTILAEKEARRIREEEQEAEWAKNK